MRILLFTKNPIGSAVPGVRTRIRASPAMSRHIYIRIPLNRTPTGAARLRRGRKSTITFSGSRRNTRYWKKFASTRVFPIASFPTAPGRFARRPGFWMKPTLSSQRLACCIIRKWPTFPAWTHSRVPVSIARAGTTASSSKASGSVLSARDQRQFKSPPRSSTKWHISICSSVPRNGSCRSRMCDTAKTRNLYCAATHRRWTL